MGPCIDAIKEHEVFQTGDLRNEKRWPNFAMRAHDETGVCSIVSIRLFIEEDTMVPSISTPVPGTPSTTAT